VAKWIVPKDWRLEWRQWESFHVVFNPASGDTHLLNAIPAFVLRSLETEARSVEELKALVSRLPEHPSDPSDIDELVSELDELGLIAAAPS
jgi:PqqD family protein of HPr-rel-A system